jgi:hypothetical protein
VFCFVLVPVLSFPFFFLFFPELSDVIQYTTRGKAFEYYDLLCARGGSYDEFMLNCRGGKIHDNAKEVTKAVTLDGREKDTLRAEVTRMIVDAISEILRPLLTYVRFQC